MTPRQPRELGITKAVEMLRKLDADFAEEFETEWRKTRDRIDAAHAKRRDAILARVHPEARAIVLREVTPRTAGEDVPAMTSDEIDSALGGQPTTAELDAEAPDDDEPPLANLAAALDEVPARLREPLTPDRLAVAGLGPRAGGRGR